MHCLPAFRQFEFAGPPAMVCAFQTHKALQREAEPGIHSGHPWPSPYGRLRRAHRQSCRCVEPGRVRPRTALRQTRKSPLTGALACLAERVGFTRAIHGPRPAGGCAVRIGSPADASNPGVFVHALRSTRHAKAPSRGPLRVWRREWDSLGPSMALALRAAAPCASAVLPMRRTRACSSTHCAPPDTQKPPRGGPCVSGGESGIRTHGGRKPTAVFKTAALNRSAISPLCEAPFLSSRTRLHLVRDLLFLLERSKQQQIPRVRSG